MMRQTIWNWFTKGLPEATLLPPWAIVLRWALFPLDTFYWKYSKTSGFQCERGVWIIHGITYSDEFFYILTKSRGEVYRITNQDGVIILEELEVRLS
jgi:hypothetical protein